MSETVRSGRTTALERNTPPRMDIYQFIVEYKKAHDGNSPSIREIVRGLDLSSPSIAAYHLTRLVQLNMIRLREDGSSRTIEITGGRWLPPERGAGD